MADDCSGANPLFNPVGCGVQKITDDTTHNMAQTFMAGYDGMLKDFITSWLGKGVMIDVTSSAALEWFRMSISTVSLFLVTLGLMFAGIKTMYEQQGRPAKEAFEALGKVVFVSAAGSVIVNVFTVGGDKFGEWILKSAGVDTGTFLVSQGIVATNPGAAIIFGLFGILTVGCQWLLMFIRGAILPLLVAWWPVSAAGAMLEGGKKGFQTLTSWLLAFVIYSPIAASIYALAWRMKNGDDGVAGVINGWALIVLAVLTLPALMRLMAPASAAVGKMAGGVMAMGITAAVVGAGVAVGSAVVSGGASAGASGGGGGGAVPNGSGSAATPGGSATSGTDGSAGASGGDGATGSSGRHAADGSSGSDGVSGASGVSGSSGSDGGSGASGSIVQDGGSGSAAGGSSSDASGLAFDAVQGALDSQEGSENVAEGSYTQ